MGPTRLTTSSRWSPPWRFLSRSTGDRGGGPSPVAIVLSRDSNGSKFVLVNKALAGYTVMAVTSEVGPSGTLAPTQQPELYGNLA
jgi:hypothetical protein